MSVLVCAAESPALSKRLADKVKTVMRTTAMLRGWLIQADVCLHGAKKIIKFTPYVLPVIHVDNGSLSPQQRNSGHKLVSRDILPQQVSRCRLRPKFQSVSVVSRVVRNLDAKCCKSEILSPSKLSFLGSSERLLTISYIGVLRSWLWRVNCAS